MRIWRDPNFWHLDRLLSVQQIDLSACADRKMVIFYVYLRYFTKKSRLYRTDMHIKKKMVCEGKTFAHRPMRICVSVYFLKKSQPKRRAKAETVSLRVIIYRNFSKLWETEGVVKRFPSDIIKGTDRPIPPGTEDWKYSKDFSLWFLRRNRNWLKKTFAQY
jgi:hypothetical protein